MKLLLILVSAFLWVGGGIAAEVALDVSLLDGSKIKGRIVAATASEITIMSDLGTLRIPLEKLTPESRQMVTQATARPDVDALLRRIAELEGKVSHLQQENEALRQQAAAAPMPTSPSSRNQFSAPTAPGTGGAAVPAGSFSISSTGKRHNSGCRYFGSGRSCGASEGIACKICGG